MSLQHGIKLKPNNHGLFEHEVCYLGRTVSSLGSKIDLADTETVHALKDKTFLVGAKYISMSTKY